MTHEMSNFRFFVIAALLLFLVGAVLFAWTRECYCDTCPNRFAIWMRGEKQLCRECKNAHDRHARRFRRKRGLPWRRAW
jgi:hypothetical protein